MYSHSHFCEPGRRSTVDDLVVRTPALPLDDEAMLPEREVDAGRGRTRRKVVPAHRRAGGANLDLRTLTPGV